MRGGKGKKGEERQERKCRGEDTVLRVLDAF